jgi:hypothetical protein
MNKKEIQKRVLQNGEPLALNKFSWDKKTRTFSTNESGLVLDFKGIDNCTFDTGYDCTFDTGYNCTFTTSYNCTFKTGSYCTFDTSYNCTFKTGSYCTFDTGYNCTFDIWELGYFTNNSKNNVVIVRDYNSYKIYQLNDLPKEKLLQLTSKYSKDVDIPKDIKLIDGSIMSINNTRKINDIDIYVVNYIVDLFKDEKIKYSYVAHQDNLYAHGKTIEKAINDLNFKKAYKLGALENAKNLIQKGLGSGEDYRLITGSCEEGTRRFMESINLDYDNDRKTIAEMIELTKGQYGHDTFVRMLKEAGWE